MKTCLYSSFSEKESIARYVKKYLLYLLPFHDKIIFITNHRTILKEDLDFLKDKNIVIKTVSNEGFDFGMYYKVLSEINCSEISELTLANDSCIPVSSFENIFNWFKDCSFDYAGITDSYQRSYYCQSYFLIARNEAVKYVIEYILQNKILNSYAEVVRVFEYGLSQYLLSKNINIGAMFSAKKYNSADISIDCAKQLIEDGNPLLKKKLITKDFRHYQRYRLESIGFNFHYDYTELLKSSKDSSKQKILEDIFQNQQLDSQPKILVYLEGSAELDEQSYGNFTMTRDFSSVIQSNAEYVLYIEDGSVLEPNGLFEFAKTICKNKPDLVYCDHSIFYKNRLTNFHLKPGFDAEKLQSINYIGNSFLFRLSSFSSDFFHKFRPEKLLTEIISGKYRVFNISKPLLRKPAYNGNSYNDYDSQSHDYFDFSPNSHSIYGNELNKSGTFREGKFKGIFIKHTISSSCPKVKIIINCKYPEKLYSKLVSSVSNLDTDFVTTVKSNNYLTKSNSLRESLRESEAGQVLIINKPFESYSNDWLSQLLQFSQCEKNGFVGAKILSRDGYIAEANMLYDIFNSVATPNLFIEDRDKGYFFDHHTTQTTFSVSPSCYMVKKEIFEAVSDNLYSSDNNLQIIEMCIRAKIRGFENIFQANAILNLSVSNPFTLIDRGELKSIIKLYDGKIDFQSHYSKKLSKLSPFSYNGWSAKYMAPAGSRELLRAGIRNIYTKLGKMSILNLVLYGAGQHTRRLLKETNLAPHNIICILDDNPAVNSISGTPVRNMQELPGLEYDVLIVSSDTLEKFLLYNVLQKKISNKVIMGIYSDFFIKLK